MIRLEFTSTKFSFRRAAVSLHLDALFQHISIVTLSFASRFDLRRQRRCGVSGVIWCIGSPAPSACRARTKNLSGFMLAPARLNKVMRFLPYVTLPPKFNVFLISVGPMQILIKKTLIFVPLIFVWRNKKCQRARKNSRGEKALQYVHNTA